MRPLLAVLLILAHVPGLRAESERAGDFDYYVLALSWSPNWCALEGDARAAAQCAPDRHAGWVLHGFWPQYERGWPSYCHSSAAPPSRAMTAAQADLFGAGGAAWYQWKKHGSCAGLAPADYFALARRAFVQVKKPPVLERLERPVRLPASVIEEAFLKENPGLTADEITVTCRDGFIQEVRLCLTRDLAPRPCAPDTARDCRLEGALFEPVR
ncbi:MAG: ribonuclease T [Alphaproteobacteria bacterium]|nr:MAG: ribonuclease T [Alphaproteobacteria bacterium]